MTTLGYYRVKADIYCDRSGEILAKEGQIVHGSTERNEDGSFTFTPTNSEWVWTSERFKTVPTMFTLMSTRELERV